MKTSQFIQKMNQKIVNNEYIVRQKCRSVFANGDCIYRYGYSYPLLFPVYAPSGKRLIVYNVSSYSLTTRRHISNGAYLVDILAELPRGTYYHNTITERASNYSQVVEAIKSTLARIQREMSTKKRHDTQVYTALARSEKDNQHYLSLLEAYNNN
jgi:hypothetical protein